MSHLLVPVAIPQSLNFGSINDRSINTVLIKTEVLSSKVQRRMAEPAGTASLGRSIDKLVDHPFGHEILGGIA
jgi:hypothetical protein